MPTGFSRRLSEIGEVCARAFPAEWWSTKADDHNNNHRSKQQQQRQQRFFLKQRLGMFFLVEYSTQVHHVTRFSLLCATDAPAVPPIELMMSPPVGVSPVLKGTEAAASTIVNDETPEDISWSIPMNKTATTNVEDEKRKSNEVCNGDAQHAEPAPRWTFVKKTKDQQQTPLHKNSNASMSDFNLRVRHIKQAAEAADRRMRAASPGGFLMPSIEEKGKGPQGRYEHHREGLNRSVLSSAMRPAWQVYDQQRYDDAVHDASRFSKEHVSAADHLPQHRQPLEHEIEAHSYLAGQRDGSMMGYLVDGPCPIARLDNLKMPVPARMNFNGAAHDLSSSSAAKALAGTKQTSPSRETNVAGADTKSSPPPSLIAECISSQTLRVLQTTSRNDVVVRTADPFLRIRRGLIPAIKRSSDLPKQQHKQQQQQHASNYSTLSPVRQATTLPSVPSVDELVITTSEGPAYNSNTTDCAIVVDHHTSGGGRGGATSGTTRLKASTKTRQHRQTFLDRFVEAVERVEIARGRDALGNSLEPKAGGDDGSSSTGSSPHSIHDNQQSGGHHRRPTPLVAFGGLTAGNGTGLGGSSNTPWTPWRTTPIAGLKDPSSSGRGDVSFATETPRSAFKRLLCVEPVAQSLDDFFYAVYSLHGGAGEGGISVTQLPRQQVGVPAMITLPLIVNVAPEVALEALFWVAYDRSPCRLGIPSVTVRCKDVVIVDSNAELNVKRDAAAVSEQQDQVQTSMTAGAPTEFECSVALQVVNDYAALANVKAAFERMVQQLTTKISSSPLPLTESLRGRIHNRKQFVRATVREAFAAQVSQRKARVDDDHLTTQPATTTTSVAAATRGGKPSTKVSNKVDEDDETVIRYRGVELTSLFAAAVPECSVNEWMVTSEFIR
jgi:hypothetical protein